MNFKGLFVGIDRYQSPSIPWLSCAKRDALAFHAIFADTFGGTPLFLTEQDATRDAVKAAFTDLTACSEDDVVVIFFSGHGSDTHELVTFDTEINDLAGTAIPLSTLAEWFSQIPAKRLICILDCCFSGGVGSKVLRTGMKSKDFRSTDDFLKQLSGNSRIILTACSSTEEAWENEKLGHGYLSYFLLEGLQGAEEVVDAGKIDLYRLLDFVTKRVKDAAARKGRVQTPTLVGQIEGEFTLPIFQKGKLYLAAFPERALAEVTSDVQSLAVYGFPRELLAAWAGAIPSLNSLQVDAINQYGLLRGENLVVSAPTSSGKTMIGELAALYGALERKRAFFLLPLKALASDKLDSFNKTYGAFGIKTIMATGEYGTDIPALMRGQYDLCLMTYEKFAALVLASPHILEQVGTIVVDEVQMIADESRGVNLEFLLTLINARKNQGVELQIIALSAVIGESNGLERWLEARLLRRSERPVPLSEGMITADGSFRYIDAAGKETFERSFVQRLDSKGSSQELIIPLVKRLVGEGKQVIVFRDTKGSARGCAQYLASNLGLAPAQEVIGLLPKGDRSISSDALHQTLLGGVAFHIADLDPDERRIVEESFRAKDNQIRVIAATTTLAMGVNTPADAVVIAGLDHPDKKAYSVAEYKNMVGRAGRLGFSKEGASYIIALSPQDEYRYWNQYVIASPEDLQSRFIANNSDPLSLVLRVLTSAHRFVERGMTAADIVSFLEGSFGAFQQKQQTGDGFWDDDDIRSLLSRLEQHGLVEKSAHGLYTLTRMGWVAGQSGLAVESVLRVIDALKPIPASQISDPILLAAVQLTVELDDVLFPINKKSTQAEPGAWFGELQRQQIPQHVLNAMHRGVKEPQQATLRAKKTVASLWWITNTPLAQIEATMTRFGGKSDGAAGPIRSVRARVCDVLPPIIGIVQILHPDLDLTERASRLLIRMEFGIPASIAELASILGNQLTRSDYLNLVNASLGSIESIEQSNDDDLLACLNQSPGKLGVVRQAVLKYHQHENNLLPSPILPPYEP